MALGISDNMALSTSDNTALGISDGREKFYNIDARFAAAFTRYVSQELTLQPLANFTKLF
jgi:hypothetical protein